MVKVRAYKDKYYKTNKLGKDIYFGRRKYPTMLASDSRDPNYYQTRQYNYKGDRITPKEFWKDRDAVVARYPWLKEEAFEKWYNTSKAIKRDRFKKNYHLVGQHKDYDKSWTFRIHHNRNKVIRKKMIDRNHFQAKIRRKAKGWRKVIVNNKTIWRK